MKNLIVIAGLVLVGSGSAAQGDDPPVNDLCSGAIEVPCDGTAIFADNRGATNTPGDPVFGCDVIPSFGVGTIWYRFTATTSAVVIESRGLTTLNGGLVALLEGSCGSFVPLRCSTSDVGFGTRTARLVASDLTPGQEYYIEMASAVNIILPGLRRLTVECVEVDPPSNDDCFRAIDMSFGSEDFSTFGATSSSPECGSEILDRTVWYRMQGNGGNLNVTCSSINLEYLQVLVYVGACSNLICVAAGTPVFGDAVSAEWCSVEGQTYYVAVGSIGDDEGGGEVTLGGTVNCSVGGGPPCTTLSFETASNGTTSLLNGLDLGAELSNTVLISTSGPNAGAAIFSSQAGGENQGAADADLLVDTGNLLILQNDNSALTLQQTIPGIYDFPNDDPDGGTFIFYFPTVVEMQSLQLVDVDNDSGFNVVVLVDVAGRTRGYIVPDGWTGDRSVGQPGMGTLDLTTTLPQPGFASTATVTEDPDFDALNVISMAVILAGSGGVDDVSWCRGGGALSVIEASSTVRNGSGTNPEVLHGWSLPLMGGTWVTGLDCSSHGAGFAGMFVFGEPRSGLATAQGELLVGGTPLFSVGKVHASEPVYFTADVPASLALLGREASAQGVCTGFPGAFLTNALDVKVGY